MSVYEQRIKVIKDMEDTLERQINKPDPKTDYILDGFTNEELNTFLVWIRSFK